MKSYQTIINEIQSSPYVSFRMKKIVEELNMANLYNALREAEVIHAIFLAKVDDIDFNDAFSKIRSEK